MRLPEWTLPLAAWVHIATASYHRDYDNNDYFAIHLSSSQIPHEIAASLGVRFEGPLGQLPDHYTFSCPKDQSFSIENTLQEIRRRRKIKRDDEQIAQSHARGLPQGLQGILWSEKQQLRKRLAKRIPPQNIEARNGGEAEHGGGLAKAAHEAAMNRLDEVVTTLEVQDPIFPDQWHLLNTVQTGHDLNVTGVWLEGFTGNGSISAVIDDGLDMYSDDLKDNYFAEGSWDFNEHSAEPKPLLFDDKHGTRCAGEIAAARNSVCGVGMAYDGQVAGIRILSKPISDEDEAAAINYQFQQNQIYSCSWGPPDDGATMEAPGILIKKAMVHGVQEGRQGLGSVFVFAAGNGAASDDNCNFDGYTNSIYSITVGGLDRQGNHPYYSEHCSAQLVVAYSSGAGDAIHTTDVGPNVCYNGHGGTSAAGPLVVGTIALALGARPDLSWRDLQYLCIEAAIPVHLEEDWQDTKIGKKFSHTYGYGKMDAYRFVEAAKSWQSVKPQAWFNSPWLSVQHPIPQGDQGLASSFDVTESMLKNANLDRLEHVTVTMNIQHARRGDLSVELQSPDGVTSHIATTRRNDNAAVGYDDWTFMSVAHWGESGAGTWTIVVKDTNVNDFNGTLTDWRLNLWGECMDPTIQQLHPLPDDHDDDHETATAAVTTTSIDPGPTPSELPAKPTDHIDRPTKPRPSESPSEAAPAGSTVSEIPTATSSVEPSPIHTPSEGFLPSFFPTFGVSKRTQIWIYGAFVLIVCFCVALGVYFYVQRKRRLRKDPRDDYEFEMLDNDDDDAGGMNGHANGKKAKRRAGELYDAFAGESDEEVFSDEDDAPYRDAAKLDEKAGHKDELPDT